MEMNLQAIYFYVGVAGFVLAAAFLAAGIAYFVRADIRGVRAELSGKTRQEGLASSATSRRPRDARRNVLTQDDSWKGVVSRGDLSASLTGDGQSGSSGSGAGSDWSYSEANGSLCEPDSDNAVTEVDELCGVVGERRAPAVNPNAGRVTAGVSASGATFSVSRIVVLVHAATVIDEQGVEVEYEPLPAPCPHEGGR